MHHCCWYTNLCIFFYVSYRCYNIIFLLLFATWRYFALPPCTKIYIINCKVRNWNLPHDGLSILRYLLSLLSDGRAWDSQLPRLTLFDSYSVRVVIFSVPSIAYYPKMAYIFTHTFLYQNNINNTLIFINLLQIKTSLMVFCSDTYKNIGQTTTGHLPTIFFSKLTISRYQVRTWAGFQGSRTTSFCFLSVLYPIIYLPPLLFYFILNIYAWWRHFWGCFWKPSGPDYTQTKNDFFFHWTHKFSCTYSSFIFGSLLLWLVRCRGCK